MKNISKWFASVFLTLVAVVALAGTPMIYQTPSGNSVPEVNLATINTFNNMGNGYTRFRTVSSQNVDIYDPSLALFNAAKNASGVVATGPNSTDERIVMNNVITHEITGGSNVTFYMTNGQTFGPYSDPSGTLNAAILALKLN